MQQRGRAQRPFDRRVGTPTRHGSPGQAIVEFALVIPLFLTVLVGVIEFGFLLNAVNTVNYATRDAALIAAEAGNNTTADCAIIKQVFADMGAPTTWDQVTEIRIYLADVNGNGANGSTVDVYSAGGSTTCVTGQDSQGHDITTDYPVAGRKHHVRAGPALQHPGRLPEPQPLRDRHDRRRGLLPVRLAHSARQPDRWPGKRPTALEGQRGADGAGAVSRTRARRLATGNATGQALYEFAIILPLFLLLLVSMLEFGFAFSHNLTLEYATREGARVGSALVDGGGGSGCPNAANVDPLIIAAVERVLTSPGSQVTLANVADIEIWKDDGSGNPTSGLVNVWSYSPGGGPVPQGSATNTPLDFKEASVGWPVCGRTAGPPADSIGVSLEYHYTFITPLGGLMRLVGGNGNWTGIDMGDKTVMAMNPSAPGS